MNHTFTLDFTQYHQRVKLSRPAIEKDVMRCVTAAAKAGRDKAREGEFKDKTGNLRKSIQVTAFSWAGNTFWSEYRTQVPYALFVEEDTVSHMIYPKAGYNAPGGASLFKGQTRRGRGGGDQEHVVGRGRALRWKDAGGAEHFARSVFHPGTYGFRFMHWSKARAENVLVQSLHGGFLNLRSVWAAN